MVSMSAGRCVLCCVVTPHANNIEVTSKLLGSYVDVESTVPLHMSSSGIKLAN